MDRIDIQVDEATAVRRRVMFDLRDVSDGMTPETSVAGQPQRTFSGIVAKSIDGSLVPDVTGTDSYAMQAVANDGLPTYYDSGVSYYLWQRIVYGTTYWYLTDVVGGNSDNKYWLDASTSLEPAQSKATITGGTDVDGTYLFAFVSAGGNVYHNGTYYLYYGGSGRSYIAADPDNGLGGAPSGPYWLLDPTAGGGDDITGTYTPQNGAPAGDATVVKVTTAQATGTADVSDATTTGVVWTEWGIGTLTEIGYGRYYAEFTAAAVDTVGDAIHTRFKSAATAETPGDWVRVVNFDPYNVGEAVFLVDLDQVEAAAPVDSLTCMILMALHSNTRDNAGKITVYRTDDVTEFTQLTYTTDANAYPIDGVG